MHKIILASQSPRRIDALHRLKIPFQSIPNTIDEREAIENSGTEPEEIARSLSERKARTISQRYPDIFVLGMDTIVVFNNVIIGKPKSQKEATEILLKLNGKWHSVITGITLIHGILEYFDSRTIKTEVKFLNHTKDFIEKYVSLGESLDKAGGYGIQSQGKRLVEKVHGDFSNVVGFPEETVISMLKNAGIYDQITDDREQMPER
jgi:septum formation protein